MQVEIFRDRPDEEEKNKKEYKVSVALRNLNTIYLQAKSILLSTIAVILTVRI